MADFLVLAIGAVPEVSLAEITDMCLIDESSNYLGSNQCSIDTECNGDRTCSSSGWCLGISGCSVSEVDKVIDMCLIDEAKN